LFSSYALTVKNKEVFLKIFWMHSISWPQLKTKKHLEIGFIDHSSDHGKNFTKLKCKLSDCIRTFASTLPK